jgi:serine/threonine-protein kinase
LALTIGLVAGSDNDIWIYDIQTTALSRLTFEKKMFDPVWSKDGKKIYYASAIVGNEGLMVQPADGSSEGISILTNKSPRFPISISPNGTQLIMNALGGPTDGDIYLIDLNNEKEPSPLLCSPGYEYGGCISPDGRYIVYGSNENGRLEIFVRTYPDLKGKWQISVKGGVSAVWSPDGKEIFYVSTVGKMMSVSIKNTPAFSADQPRELFDVSQMYFPNNPITNFDITPDGRRFIMVRNARVTTNVTSYNIVLNWVEELQHQMPMNK